MAYYSPEHFDVRDGDHDHPLHAAWRTPREAAKLTLVFKDSPGFTIGVQTPDGELHLPTDKPQPQVFTAWLRRDAPFVYEPGMLEEDQ